MLPIYERALQQLDNQRDAPLERRIERAREVAFEVGKEALAENGEWLMLHHELPLDPPHV